MKQTKLTKEEIEIIKELKKKHPAYKNCADKDIIKLEVIRKMVARMR